MTWTVNGNAVLTLSGGLLCKTANSGNNRTLTIGGNGTIAVSGVFYDNPAGGGRGGLATASTFAGQLTLSNNNTHGYGTTHRSGTIHIGHNSALGSGTLTLGGSSLTSYGTIAASGGARTLANALVVQCGAIGGSQDVTFNGSSGVPSTGVTTTSTIAGWVLKVTNTGITTFANVFSFGTQNSGNERRLEVDTASGARVLLSGGIASDYNRRVLDKRGLGVLVLGGTSTYRYDAAAGVDTHVNAGALVVNGVLDTRGSSVTVYNTATLCGAGTINRAVTVSSGGTVAPGEGTADDLTFGGNLTLSSGALAAFTAVGGASPDVGRLLVTGQLGLNNNAVTINVTGARLGGGSPTSYTLATYGTISGSFNATPTITGMGLTGGSTASISAAGGLVTLNVTAGDVAGPVWAGGYPLADTATASGFTAKAKTDESGTVYYVVVADGATAPSAEQIAAGQDSTGSAALAAGSFALTAATETSAVVSDPDLLSNTPYDVYFAPRDTYANAGTVAKADVTTTGSDSEPPTWAGGYPNVDGPTYEGFTVNAQVNENGAAYYVVVADGATAPSAAQIKAGHDASDAAALAAGMLSLGADTPASDVVTGLADGTAFDVYIVAQDGSVPPNVTAPVKVDATTLDDATAPSWSSGYPKADMAYFAGFTVRASIDEDGTASYVVLPDGANQPSVAQIMAGQDAAGQSATKSGILALVADIENSATVSGLPHSTPHDVYFVAKDVRTPANIQGTVQKVDVTTASNVISWDGDTSIAWATGGNWVGGVAPSDNTTDNVVGFNLAGYSASPDLSTTFYAPNAGTRSIKGIEIGAANGAMALSGTQLTIGAGGLLIANGAGALTLSSPTTLADNQTWANADDSVAGVNGAVTTGGKELTIDVSNGTGQRMSIAGNVTGTGSIRKIGTGELYLSYDATYGFTGGLTIEAGNVLLGVGSGASGSLNCPVTVNGGNLLVNPNNTSSIPGLDGSGGAVRPYENRTLSITAAGGQTYAYSGQILNNRADGTPRTLAISKNGDGAQVFAGDNTYGGATAVNEGTLLVNGVHSGTGAYSVSAGAVLGGGGSLASAEVTFDPDAFAVFDLDAGQALTLTGANAILNGNGAKIRIKAAALDGRGQYSLFVLLGQNALIQSGFDPVPEWIGTAPDEAGSYRIASIGKMIVLRRSGTMFIIR
jgi:autotransporter-associated beta strand protein